MRMPFQELSAERRSQVQNALRFAFESNSVHEIELLRGNKHSASLYRIDACGRTFVLRVEGPRAPQYNPHQYTCMQIASDAGIAPELHFIDPESGIAIMDYIAAAPLVNYPGGAFALAKSLGKLAARLQKTTCFPVFQEFRFLLSNMFEYLSGPDVTASRLLAPHGDVFQRIYRSYPWGKSPPVSSHNDLNPQNVVFDGHRLWLVDWETACCNDPLIDIAFIAENFARTQQLETVLLEGWNGKAPDTRVRAQLLLARQLTKIYYAGLYFGIGRSIDPRAQPLSDLRALSRAEFAAAVAQGQLVPGSPEILYALGKMSLASFLSRARTRGFEIALTIAQR